VCPRCGDIKQLNDFKDSSLKTGIGRFCLDCKLIPTYVESSVRGVNKDCDARTLSKAAREEYRTILKAKEKKERPRKEYIALKECLNSFRSVKIRYKGTWRTIDPYLLNETYVVSYCHSALDMRTFRIDRIQDVELLDRTFNLDKSLQSSAQAKLSNASNYRGHRQGY